MSLFGKLNIFGMAISDINLTETGKKVMFDRKLIAVLAIISVVYFVLFGFLFTKSENYTGVIVYTDELLKALLAAGTVAILTSIIFIFQDKIEQRGKKEDEVFKVKISFYSELIKNLERIEKDREIDEEELHQLHFLTLRSVMFASPEVYRSLSTYHELCNEPKDETFKKRQLLIVEIVEAARKDLEVQDPIPDVYRNDFKASLQNIVSKAVQLSEISASEKRVKRTAAQKRKIIEDYENHGEGRSIWLKETHNLVPAYIATWRKKMDREGL